MPGRAPPPHLSPFVDDKAEGYVPRQREILDKFAAETAAVGSTPAIGETSEKGEVASADAPRAAAKSAEETFDQFSKELQAESKGVWHSAFEELPDDLASGVPGTETKTATENAVTEEDENLVHPPKPTEDEEERLRAKALMPKKHKRLLQRIEYTAQQKDDKKDRLLKKRKELESSKAYSLTVATLAHVGLFLRAFVSAHVWAHSFI